MAENSGANKGLYFIVGALVVAVAVIAYLMMGGNDEPDLSIKLGEDGIEIDTPN